MTTIVNEIQNPVALLKPEMPSVYNREQVYDPTWNDNRYNSYLGKRIIPAVGSIVKDPDNTPLWVIQVDPVTYIPTYTSITISDDNSSVTSLLNYGNALLRLFVDTRTTPHPATPDSKCVFIGKSPRYYTLTRYPDTDNESVVSQYYDATGKLTSQLIPLVALDDTKSSWYLPRCHTAVALPDNEEIRLKVYSEDGVEIYNALLFVKHSSIINEDVAYVPKIVDMTVEAHQTLADGSFFVYEKQSFSSLGLLVKIIYSDGTRLEVPIDGAKCILYGEDDFISSFSGLKQTLLVKYYRSSNETFNAGVGDATGSLISKEITVKVIPNTLATTAKVLVCPMYNASLARYLLRYIMYFGDGRQSIDVTAYSTILSGNPNTSATGYGLVQSFVVGVDMSKVDPLYYKTATIYQQNITIQFYPPTSLVRWIIRDNTTAVNAIGQDNALSKRASIRYDTTRKQYFIPSAIFANQAAFINSFYTQATPPYDPSITTIPQLPTHFVVRDLLSNSMLINAPIPIANYASAFNIINDVTGQYVNSVVVVEFSVIPNNAPAFVVFGIPVDVTTGTYIG